MPEDPPDATPAAQASAGEPVPERPPTHTSVDEMSEASFPASDPPAVWTWDPPREARR